MFKIVNIIISISIQKINLNVISTNTLSTNILNDLLESRLLMVDCLTSLNSSNKHT